MKPVKDFLGKPAPAGYVAGAGRHGFTTRPDAAGEARDVIDTGAGDDEAGLLAGGVDPDDLEAARLYASIDAVMASRGKPRKNPNTIGDSEGTSGLRDPKEMFKDLREPLGRLSAEEWAAIPEAGDRRAKKARKEILDRFTPVPDNIILSTTGNTLYSGFAEEGASSNPSGNDILSRLSSQMLNGDSLDRARTLIRGMIRGNPDNPEVWMAAIRLEAGAGRNGTARNMGKQAVERIQNHPELWLECAAVAEDKRQKLSDALQHAAPEMSWEPVWMAAVECEPVVLSKQLILRRALKQLPSSPRLWQYLIDLSEDRVPLLAKACELCAGHVDFWIQLAEKETHENAVKVLNSALKQNPHSMPLWMAILRQTGDASIAKMAIEQCNIGIGTLNLEDSAESRLIATELVKHDPRAYIKHQNEVIRRCSMELLLSDYCEDGRACEAIVEQEPSLAGLALQKFPSSPKLWLLFLASHPIASNFERALTYHPQNEHIWLLYVDSQPEVLSLHERAYQTVESAEIAYRYVLLMGRLGMDCMCILESSVQRHPGHEGLLLLYAGHSPDRLSAALGQCPQGIHLWIRTCLLAPTPSTFRAAWERATRHHPKNELLWLCMLCSFPSPSLSAQSVKECPHSGLLHRHTIVSMEPNASVRRARALNIMKQLPSDPNIQALMGQLLAEEGREQEAREYYERALDCAGKYSDVYAECAVRMPDLASRARELFRKQRPTVSGLLLDRTDFTFDELVAVIR